MTVPAYIPHLRDPRGEGHKQSRPRCNAQLEMSTKIETVSPVVLTHESLRDEGFSGPLSGLEATPCLRQLPQTLLCVNT